MSLLSGLEEENSEHFPVVMNLMEELKKINETLFCHAIWKALLLNPSLRIAALNYLLEKLTKEGRC